MIMNDTRIRIRANRSTGELEVEGSSQAVAEWWNKLWPELGDSFSPPLLLRPLQGFFNHLCRRAPMASFPKYLVVSDGKYRVSARGFEYLKSLKAV
jgi:hypothetical protein